MTRNRQHMLTSQGELFGRLIKCLAVPGRDSAVYAISCGKMCRSDRNKRVIFLSRNTPLPINRLTLNPWESGAVGRTRTCD